MGRTLKFWTAVLIAAPMVAACGDTGKQADPVGSAPIATESACVGKPSGVGIQVDLNGDGHADEVSYDLGDAGCDPAMTAKVGDTVVRAAYRAEAPLTDKDFRTVQIPGRSGELVLVRERHPRGGFQAHLFGYADGALAELTVNGEPIFGFIATDVQTSPLAATCAPGGFEVRVAKAHEPIGVLATWDVYATTYQVRGNKVIAGIAAKIADNVLEDELPQKYPALVDHQLFENCPGAQR